MSLSSIYAEYLASLKEEKERDPLRLFISDIGKCPRQIAYRMMQTSPDFTSEQEKINKAIMFDIANQMEERLANALDAVGMLVAYQDDIEFPPEYKNWGGRLDIIADYNGRRVIEVKTTHPGAFKFDLDYPEHHYQAAAYDLFCGDKYELDCVPMLVYFDRGGQNTPVEKRVYIDDIQVRRAMDELMWMRDLIPELPNKLDKILKIRSRSKEIKLEPDYRCGRCDYAGTCKPDMGTEVWAKREDAKSLWNPTRKADPKRLEEFTHTMVGGA